MERSLRNFQNSELGERKITNNYVSCADLLLEEAKRDLEASRLLYDGKYMEQSLFYLQQANEKLHKAFRCAMQYLFQNVPEKVGECLESKLANTSSYYPMIYAVTYYIKQLNINDIEEFLKEKYSHDTIKGFFEELEEFTEDFKFLKNVLVHTLRAISQNVANLIDDIIDILIERVIDYERQELKNYLTQKHTEEEYIRKIIEYYNYLNNSIVFNILSTFLYNYTNYISQNISNITVKIFDEKTKEEYDKSMNYVTNYVLYAFISYKMLILLNLVLSNYTEASRYPDLKTSKPTKDRIPQYISQNLEQLMNSTKLSLDFIGKLVETIKNIENNFSSICYTIKKVNISEELRKIDEIFSIHKMDLLSILNDVNKLIQKKENN
ncbi:hypothetical protein EWF20_10475 [Sulfolobus sp. S-194]|uniref:HEPN domain-containing protein n=1 Tax=Sulfolobus sp. S-194 TaxID=2512240 RepID=UPI001436F4D7|nr:HEPN domain-containing protein [Sulfolobus sp. S-194]QIW24521.1 hypothetical protein EWF20_10475 [Sulfolobus sp. S-194]